MEKKVTRVQPQHQNIQSPPAAKFSSSVNSQTFQLDFGKSKAKGKGGNSGERDGVVNSKNNFGNAGRGGSRGHKRRPPPNQQSNEVNRVGSDHGQLPQRVTMNGGDKASRHGANASHLLNFTYSPLPSQEGGGSRGRHPAPYRGGRSRMQSVHTKEQFLQAHCQFVVKESAADMDYVESVTDPDKMVNWENIEQVILNDEDQLSSCPICLEVPIAAKITKCAHIYCWPCILHFFAENDTRPKCPICYDRIEEKDLKSVRIQSATKYKVGDELTFYLMKRERESQYVRPKSSWRAANGGRLFTLTDSADDARYSKLLSAAAEDIEEIINTEKRQLLQLLDNEDTQSLEASFVQASLNQLAVRSKELELCKRPLFHSEGLERARTAAVSSGLAQEQVPVHSVRSDSNLKAVTYASAFDDDEGSAGRRQRADRSSPSLETSLVGNVSTTEELTAAIGELTVTAEEPHVTAEEPHAKIDAKYQRVRNNCSSSSCDSGEAGEAEMLVADLKLPATGTQSGHSSGSKRKEVYYFYQSADGQHVYLHSVNTRILAAQYKSLEMAPPTLTATIVECEENSMTPELRKKLKYLRHLSLHSQFLVCEVTLRPPIVSSSCLANFREELNYRKRMRNRRQRTEAKHHSRVQAEERRKMGKYPDMCLPLSSDCEFPESSAVFPAAMSAAAAAHSDTASPATQLHQHAVPERQHGVPITTPYSFAQAMSGGPNPATLWPRVSATSRYVRSNGPQTEKLNVGHQLQHGDIEEGEMGAVSAPTFQESFTADFDQMLQASAAVAMKGNGGEMADENNGKQSKDKQKKKKKKQLVLFTTSGQRTNT